MFANLYIDFETRSKQDLLERGAYVYAADLSTKFCCWLGPLIMSLSSCGMLQKSRVCQMSWNLCC